MSARSCMHCSASQGHFVYYSMHEGTTMDSTCLQDLPARLVGVLYSESQQPCTILD